MHVFARNSSDILLKNPCHSLVSRPITLTLDHFTGMRLPGGRAQTIFGDISSTNNAQTLPDKHSMMCGFKITRMYNLSGLNQWWKFLQASVSSCVKFLWLHFTDGKTSIQTLSVIFFLPAIKYEYWDLFYFHNRPSCEHEFHAMNRHYGRGVHYCNNL